MIVELKKYTGKKNMKEEKKNDRTFLFFSSHLSIPRLSSEDVKKFGHWERKSSSTMATDPQRPYIF